MQKTKLLLPVGGVLILVAIVLRISGVVGTWPIVCFASGGLLKAIYLILGVRSGKFVIGKEIVLLPIGIVLVICGVFFKRDPLLAEYYIWLIVSGVSLKTTFLLLFFRRQRRRVD